jgi:hypothetical protein
MMKNLTHIIVILIFSFFNGGSLLYSENQSHERTEGVVESRAVAFNSQEAVILLSNFAEEKVQQVNSLRDKGHQNRSPFSPPVEDVNKTPLQPNKQRDVEIPKEQSSEIVLVQLGAHQIAATADHKKDRDLEYQPLGMIHQEIRSQDTQYDNPVHLDSEVFVHRHAVKSLEDKDSNEGVKSSHEYLTKVISETQDQPYEREFSLNGKAIVYEFSGEGISGILAPEGVNAGKMKNPEDQNEESRLEMETSLTLIKMQDFPRLPQSDSKIQQIESQVPEYNKSSTDVRSRLEALSEWVSDMGRAGSSGELKRLAEHSNDAEVQDYCAENPEDPNCVVLFNALVNQPLRVEDDQNKDSEIKNGEGDRAENDQPKEQEELKEEEVDKEASPQTLEVQESTPLTPEAQVSVTPTNRFEFPMGHPDFYLPWERTTLKAPQFTKVNEPKVSVTAAETVPKMMARLSPQEALLTQMEKLSEDPQDASKYSSLLSEEISNPFFDSNLNPPVRGPSFKLLPIAPLREIRVKYVARSVTSPWVGWQRFQLLFEIFRPYIVADWYWMSWVSQQENQLLRNLGFKE